MDINRVFNIMIVLDKEKQYKLRYRRIGNYFSQKFSNGKTEVILSDHIDTETITDHIINAYNNEYDIYVNNSHNPVKL